MTLHSFKPWPFRTKQFKKGEWLMSKHGAKSFEIGRELGAFLYTSVPFRVWDGLVQFIHEKDGGR